MSTDQQPASVLNEGISLTSPSRSLRLNHVHLPAQFSTFISTSSPVESATPALRFHHLYNSVGARKQLI